jgi:hypothetical protein
MMEVAAGRLEGLAAREGTLRAPRELLIRNLSRYFARYLVPSSREELGRVLGTAQRMTAETAVGLYSALRGAAGETSAEVIEAGLVQGLMRQVLPAAPPAHGEIVFLPAPPDGRGLTIEVVDLQVFADTGFAWGVLAAIDDTVLVANASPTPLTAAAIEAFHEGINAYALLLFRTAGLHAKNELASHIQTRHLRAAGKTLASGTVADLLEEPAALPTGGPFTDVTEASGLDFRHVTSSWLTAYRRYGPIAPSFSGGGVSAGDLDGDGWDDLVVCGGEGCAAFRNQRDGTFEDVTTTSGIRLDGEARMAVIADFDNDGDRDLFITYARDTNRLLANRGDGVFADVTPGSGLEREGDISGPAAAVDIDGDGLLDLYVGNFGDYLAGESPQQSRAATNGMPNRLYRNLGGLKFEDASAASGIGNTGWTQALSHADLDRDGDQDLYVANDFGHNALLLNDGQGHFEDAAATTNTDDRNHGMNVSFADLNRDGRPDIFVTNIWFWDALEGAAIETNTLLLSADASGAEGHDAPRFRRFEEPRFLGYDTGWSWGALFLDLDNDADEDLIVVNGFTDYLTFIQKRPHPEIEGRIYPINNGGDPNWLFRQDGELEFVPVRSSVELDSLNSRSVALLDFDRDGDLDAAISTFHSRTRLFRNDAPESGSHWLEVELVGDPARGVNRDAIGAQLLATSESGLHAWRSVTGGEGYLSQQSLRLELGLGEARSADLEILWPDGSTQRLANVAADQRIRVRLGTDGFEVVRLE